MFTLALSHEDVLGLWIAGVVFVACVIALYFGLRHKATLAARPSSNPPKPHPSQHEAVPPVIDDRTTDQQPVRKPAPAPDQDVSPYAAYDRPELDTDQLFQFAWMIMLFNDPGHPDVETVMSQLSLHQQGDFAQLTTSVTELYNKGGIDTLQLAGEDIVTFAHYLSSEVREHFRCVVLQHVDVIVKIMELYNATAASPHAILPTQSTLRTLQDVADFELIDLTELIDTCHWLFGLIGLGPAALHDQDLLTSLRHNRNLGLVLVRTRFLAKKAGYTLVDSRTYNEATADHLASEIGYINLLIQFALVIKDLYGQTQQVLNRADADSHEPNVPRHLPTDSYVCALVRLHARRFEDVQSREDAQD